MSTSREQEPIVRGHSSKRGGMSRGNVGSKKFYVTNYILFISHFIGLVNGWCSGIGSNPGFHSAPTVSQISLTSVQISWKDIVTSRTCADQFVVKYWKSGSPSRYKMSDKVTQDVDAIILKGIIPKIEYTYQAIAVETKSLGRIDYNYSPLTRFTTSSYTKNEKSNENNLNVLSVGSNEKKEPIKVAKVASRQPVGNKNDEIQARSSLVSTEFDSLDSDGTEEKNDVVLLVFIVIGVLIALLVIVGLVYNIVKRRKQGRNVFSGSRRDDISLKDIESVEDGSDSEDNMITEKEIDNLRECLELNNPVDSNDQERNKNVDISDNRYEDDPKKNDIKLEDGQNTIETQKNSNDSPTGTASAPVDDSINQEIDSDNQCPTKEEVITDTCFNSLKDDTEIKGNKDMAESSIETKVDQTEDKDETAPLLEHGKPDSDVNDKEETKDFDIAPKDNVSEGKDESINES